MSKQPGTVIMDEDIVITANENDFKSRPIHTFEEIELPDQFFRLFKEANYVRPTKIQSIAIPIVLESFDLIGVAKTGSGKTLSFIIPILMAIMEEKKYCQEKGKPYNNEKTPRAVVMAPTRELVCQIFECAKPYAKAVDLDIVCVYGGADIHYQKSEVHKGCDLVIATPGRLYDFAGRNNIELGEVFIFVLDEADRMLDMGFLPQVRSISNFIKDSRQTLLWSATWPPEVEELSRNLCKNKPITIKVGNEGLTVNNSITQHVLCIEDNDKKKELYKILRSNVRSPNDKVIIFATTKRNCDFLAGILNDEGYKALAIHGDKHQSERDRIIESFRGSSNILVATDVASRGLDIKNIKIVVNYDFPQNIEDYVHRIGRTGRAGATGESYTLFTSRDGNHASSLIELLEKSKQRVPDALRGMGGGGFGRSRSRYSSWGESSDRPAFEFKQREEGGNDENRGARGGFGGGGRGGRGGFGGNREGSGERRGGFGGGGFGGGGGGFGDRKPAGDRREGRGGGAWGGDGGGRDDDDRPAPPVRSWGGAGDDGASKGGWGSSPGPAKATNWGDSDAGDTGMKSSSWGDSSAGNAGKGGWKEVTPPKPSKWGKIDEEVDAPKSNNWGGDSQGGKASKWGGDDSAPASKAGGWGSNDTEAQRASKWGSDDSAAPTSKAGGWGSSSGASKAWGAEDEPVKAGGGWGARD